MAEDKPPPGETSGDRPCALTRDEVAARKRRIAEGSRNHPYRRQTNLSLIVLSFNHRARIATLLGGMRRTCAEEVIVCEDGSWDGSLEEWDRVLDRRNDLLLRSNDLHEIRAYDRAIHLASAPIVCLLQDDDQLPVDGGWAAEALALFADDPQLAIVSGYFGWLGGPYGTVSTRRQHGIPYHSPVTRAPFMYVAEAFVGPFFIRKEFYEAVGGFDHSYSEPGAPGIHFETELCWRAWVAGWRVGLFSCFVKGDAGAGVTPGTWWSIGARRELGPRNRRRVGVAYDAVKPDVVARARELNRTRLIEAPEEAEVAVSARRSAPRVEGRDDRRRSKALILRGGAVAHRGAAIAVIGDGGSGTSQLVAALARAGASPIADGILTFDAEGHVRIPADDLPAPGSFAVELVVAAEYREDACWSPDEVSGSRAALLILRHVGPRAASPHARLRLATLLASRATTLSGPRPDADQVAVAILARLGELLDRRGLGPSGAEVAEVRRHER